MVLTSWSRLLDYLKSAFPDGNYHLNQEVISLEAGDCHKPARVHFASGHSVTADLVVAADGLKSNCRRFLDVNFQQVYAGYVAWRAVCDLSLLSASSQALMADTGIEETSPHDAPWIRWCQCSAHRRLWTD